LCRIHPLNVLLALKAYEKGKPAKSSKTEWKVNADVAAALDCAFYKSFKVTHMLRNCHCNNIVLCSENQLDEERKEGMVPNRIKFCPIQSPYAIWDHLVLPATRHR